LIVNDLGIIGIIYIKIPPIFENFRQPPSSK